MSGHVASACQPPTHYHLFVGGVPKTATNPEMEAQTVQRWHDYLRSQNIEVTRTTGCRLDTDAAQNTMAATDSSGPHGPEGTLRQHAWRP